MRGCPNLFGLSLLTICLLGNKSPSKFLDSRCVEEVLLGKDIDYSTLKIFGCKVYVHIPSDERNKLKQKSLECIFLYFENGVKGYRLWDSKTKKKVLSRDVIFDERFGAKDADKEEVHEMNHTKVPLSKEKSIPENHAEVEQAPREHEAPREQQALEEVQAEPQA